MAFFFSTEKPSIRDILIVISFTSIEAITVFYILINSHTVTFLPCFNSMFSLFFNLHTHQILAFFLVDVSFKEKQYKITAGI